MTNYERLILKEIEFETNYFVADFWGKSKVLGFNVNNY